MFGSSESLAPTVAAVGGVPLLAPEECLASDSPPRVRLLYAAGRLRTSSRSRREPGKIECVNTSSPARTADVIRAELLAGIDVTAADEKLLVELAANAAAIALQTGVAADRLAHVLPSLLADARKAALVAKTLHEVVTVGNALVRRIEGTLSTAATLRLQRRLRRGRDDY